MGEIQARLVSLLSSEKEKHQHSDFIPLPRSLHAETGIQKSGATLFMNTSEGVIELDEQYRIQMINPCGGKDLRAASGRGIRERNP